MQLFGKLQRCRVRHGKRREIARHLQALRVDSTVPVIEPFYVKVRLQSCEQPICDTIFRIARIKYCLSRTFQPLLHKGQ